MTTHHHVDLSWIGGATYLDRAEQTEQDRLLIRQSAKAATDHNAAVFITEKDEELLGAIIPASLAKELVAEGRLNYPPIASMTVVDWSSWEKKNQL